ncbi:MFS transporter [Promethearchaeum syntrophicum]|uniref:MFS transporter n=1 Tax=Promethearchaeum syntrophicum TaxID=2594042 RepID=A0A5B9DC04_9ARCH|nr:MFS transporter [Candidatus Prometheoarchaeum syntrophicum]QEE16397.1 Major Facilitator Superfamily protein [Candidatus Prometheoarchaeum syntrophicum]
MSDTKKNENLEMSERKRVFSKLFSKDLVLLYLTFCLFFMLNEIIGLGGDLFFTENEEFIILSALKMFGTISLIFLPILIVRLSTKIGNIWVARIAVIALTIFGILIFFDDRFIYLYLFTFPVIIRFINNSLNPFMIKKSKNSNSLQDNLSKVFAIRDFFLYLGCGLGALIGTFLKKINPLYEFLFQVSASIILLLLAILFLGFKPKKSKLEPQEVEEEKNESHNKMRFKDVKNRKYLIVFLVISCLNSFIGTLFVFLPTLTFFTGLDVINIFQSFSIGYIIVAFLSIALAFIAPKSKKKDIYIIDIIFDIIPLGLILFSNGNLIIISIAIILFIGRDFIKPISMDYFFSLFNSEETEYIWGLIGTIPSIFSFGFTLIIPILIILNWKIPVIVAIVISVVVTLIAFKWLPSSKNSEEI